MSLHSAKGGVVVDHGARVDASALPTVAYRQSASASPCSGQLTKAR